MKRILLLLLIAITSCEVDTPVLSNDLLNYYRTQGIGDHVAVHALKTSQELEIVAQYHADYMSNNEHLSHIWKDGTTLGKRLKTHGVVYSIYGENVCFGFDTEEEAIDAWINSKGHCANIMNKEFNKVGIARSGKYWAMVLTN